MLPIEFKEKILDGTMCAFVSKRVELYVGEEFVFINSLGWDEDKQKYTPTVTVSDIQSYYAGKDIIAKAECLGVVKVSIGLSYNRDNLGKIYLLLSVYNHLIFSKNYSECHPSHINELGFSTSLEAHEYYKSFLDTFHDNGDYPDHLKGYLHIFKLVGGE